MRPRAQESRGTEVKHHSLTLYLCALGPWKGAGQIQVGQGSQSSISLSLHPSGSTWASCGWEGLCPSWRQHSSSQVQHSQSSARSWAVTVPRKLSQALPEPPALLPWGWWDQGRDHRSLKDCFLRETAPSALPPWDCYFYSHRARETLVCLQTPLPCALEWQPRLPVSSSCTRITKDRALDKANELQIKLFWKPQRNTNWKSLETKHKHLLVGFSCLAMGF